MAWDPELKRKWDNQAALDYAIANATPEALEKAKARVFEKAVQEGDHKVALEIVGRLKVEGFSKEFIAKTNKISIEE